jgi:hypothetical protein
MNSDQSEIFRGGLNAGDILFIVVEDISLVPEFNCKKELDPLFGIERMGCTKKPAEDIAVNPVPLAFKAIVFENVFVIPKPIDTEYVPWVVLDALFPIANAP